MKQPAKENVKTKDRENHEENGNGQEHLELLRSSRHFKHVIKKEKFGQPSKIDMLLTKLYLTL